MKKPHNSEEGSFSSAEQSGSPSESDVVNKASSEDNDEKVKKAMVWCMVAGIARIGALTRRSHMVELNTTSKVQVVLRTKDKDRGRGFDSIKDHVVQFVRHTITLQIVLSI